MTTVEPSWKRPISSPWRSQGCSALAQQGAEHGRVVAVPFGQRAEAAEDLAQEEAEPDALAPPFRADEVHAVVPVAGADQRQAVFAEAQAVPQGVRRVLVQARLLA